MVRGPEPGRIFPLADASLTIGRDPLSDILIKDPEVSRQHALLISTSTGEYRLQDLGSTNGTYVDGRRLGSKPSTLRPSQAITIGGAVTIIFRQQTEGKLEGNRSEGVDYQPDLRNGEVTEPKPPGADAPIFEEKLANSAESDETEGAAELSSASSIGEEQDLIGQPLRERRHVMPAESPQRQDKEILTDEPISAQDRYDSQSSEGLSPNLILGLVLLLFCSCLSLILFLFYLGGDWFLRQAGLVP